jgi:hypothetical protein
LVFLILSFLFGFFLPFPGGFPYLTGFGITFSMFLIYTAISERVKKANFEIFFRAHHFFIVFFFFLILHGPTFFFW